MRYGGRGGTDPEASQEVDAEVHRRPMWNAGTSWVRARTTRQRPCLLVALMASFLMSCETRQASPSIGSTTEAPNLVLVPLDFLKTSHPGWNAWLNESVDIDVLSCPVSHLHKIPGFDTGNYSFNSGSAESPRPRPWDLSFTLRGRGLTRRHVLYAIAQQTKLNISWLMSPTDPDSPVAILFAWLTVSSPQ